MFLFSLMTHCILQSPRLHCSIADTFGYKVIEALGKISNTTDASAAYLTVGSKMTPMCIGLELDKMSSQMLYGYILILSEGIP